MTLTARDVISSHCNESSQPRAAIQKLTQTAVVRTSIVFKLNWNRRGMWLIHCCARQGSAPDCQRNPQCPGQISVDMWGKEPRIQEPNGDCGRQPKQASQAELESAAHWRIVTGEDPAFHVSELPAMSPSPFFVFARGRLGGASLYHRESDLLERFGLI